MELKRIARLPITERSKRWKWIVMYSSMELMDGSFLPCCYVCVQWWMMPGNTILREYM